MKNENLKYSKRSIVVFIFADLNSFIKKRMTVSSSDLTSAIGSDVNNTKFLRPRPRPPEVNKGTWWI